ncbi:MAG: L-arabinose transport system permease protein AraQ [Anaerolineae bacterium]|nr:L-arabinose transport system permease protein AraQ [Anaerolineae bacterium]
MTTIIHKVRNPNWSLPRKRSEWIIWIILALMFLFYLMPVYVMVVNGLKEAAGVSLSTMWNPPASLNGGGFLEAWERLSPNMYNSLLMVVPATIISSLIGAINGYLLAKWKFRGSDLLFTLMLFGFFIPYQAILIPLVQFLQLIKVYGTIPGLIMVHVIYGLPITTLIFRNYFVGVPTELVEAARVDGAGVVKTFTNIMLPLSIPAFVVVGIFQFTNIWNDFLFGVTVVPNPAAQPVTIALNNLSGSFSVDWNVVMAGAVVAALPTAMIYILLGRYFIRGLLAGSVKG